MGDILSTIGLGMVQGITEFLPVSSSAHLIIYSKFINGDTLPIEVNIALHLGTLLAVLGYFFKDWIRIISEFLSFKYIFSSQLFYLFMGSLPAGIVGILWQDEIESMFHNPLSTCIPLILVGILLWWVDEKFKSTKSKLNVSKVLLIGVWQALALIPGVSRSGSTIIGGRIAGLDRTEATKFSFLLGTPAMFGATLLNLEGVGEAITSADFFPAFIAAVITGFLAIHLLMRMVRRTGFLIFTGYRILLAIFIFICHFPF